MSCARNLVGLSEVANLGPWPWACLEIMGSLTPDYFDFPTGSSAHRGAALAAVAMAAVRAVFDLRRSRQV